MTAGARSILGLYERLLNSWSVDTGRHWRADSPASGQCGVTALVVHDELGGEILKTDVNGAWHFYNLIGGKRIDFTMRQFDSPISYDDVPSNRDEALDDTSPERYRRLREQVAKASAEAPTR